jgi:hypothetical protein
MRVSARSRRPQISQSSSTELSPAPLPPNLDRRWLQYSLAAAAGMAMAVQPAAGQIVYTPPRSHILTPFSYLPIDFNHDGPAEFSVICNYSSLFGFGSLNLYKGEELFGLASASVVGTLRGEQVEAAALPAGAPIGPGAHFLNLNRRVALMGFNHSMKAGRWDDVQHRFLGLRFTVHGDTYYGWAEFSVSFGIPGHPLWVVAVPEGYAYESTPNTPIIAGQRTDSGSSAEPAPATLGRLALGAPGLALWRKKAAVPGAED